MKKERERERERGGGGGRGEKEGRGRDEETTIVQRTIENGDMEGKSKAWEERRAVFSCSSLTAPGGVLSNYLY